MKLPDAASHLMLEFAEELTVKSVMVQPESAALVNTVDSGDALSKVFLFPPDISVAWAVTQ
jgi:hypothetical protein